MTGNGTYRERLENLESKFEEIEAGIAKIDRIERMLEQVLRKKSKKGDLENSSAASTESDSSSDDSRLARVDEDEQRPRRGEDAWKGKPKLVCPTFNGDGPVTWLSRVSQYFDLNEIAKSEMVRYAAYFLEGEANVWWQWLSRVYKKKGKQIRWREFQKEIMGWFGPSEYTDHDELLAHIRQKGTLREYQQEFEKLASRVHDWLEKALVGAFMGGLRPEIAAEVRVHRPRTYTQAIDLARLQEDHLNAAKKIGPPGVKRTGAPAIEQKGGPSWGSTNKGNPHFSTRGTAITMG